MVVLLSSAARTRGLLSMLSSAQWCQAWRAMLALL